MKTLNVFQGRQLLGILYDSEPLSFRYVGDCAAGKIPSPFADVIPLSPDLQSDAKVAAFFENLLPEGEQRAIVEARHHVSTVFGLLEVLGGETVGALVITAHDHIEPARYLNTTWASVQESGAALHEDEIASTLQGNTISGAQYKILLYLETPNAAPQLPMGGALTTHILKPDIVHAGAKVWATAANETLMMMAAKKCGLGVAEVRYIEAAQSCLVERFDRYRDAEGNWQKHHQADL
ncbi:MAG: HipA domain-containing protein, partial [Gallionellaceae bacterium]|nr:HipA domain-containing protein [Gallionellaceae bacterium]